MKSLTLIRHAKSSWKNPDQADFERPLNKRGKKDAPLMAEKLAANMARPDLILSSSAKRAIDTAKIFAEKLDYPKSNIVQQRSIYEAGLSELLDIIHAIDDTHSSVLLFGHNPGFTYLGELLTNHEVENIPTCGIFAMQFAVSSWREIAPATGTLVSFDYPKRYK